jgi:hypothetical protein
VAPAGQFPGLRGSYGRSSAQLADGSGTVGPGACSDEEQRVAGSYWAKGRVGQLLPRKEDEKWVGLLWMLGRMQRDR